KRDQHQPMKSFVINLDRRPDRLQQFYEGLPLPWPFAFPQRFAAIEAAEEEPPAWWHVRRGAWGAYRSSLALLEAADGDVAVFEDDATFDLRFYGLVHAFLEHVPDVWDMLYFGGQHIRQAVGRPRRVNDLVMRGFNINRLHAYAVRGRFLTRLVE